MIDNNLLVPVERVERTILLVRGQKVILDADLAKLYGVTTKRLNQQVKRNSDRFPEDFMFRLTQKEKDEVVANCNHLSNLRFSPALPHAFTEHGAIMAASVLNTPRAIESSIFVVRAFVRLRQILVTHTELAQKLLELEAHLKDHDQQIQAIFEAIHQLMAPPEKPKKKIGYTVQEKQKTYGKKRKRKKIVKKSQEQTL
ncbi:MAG: ORF6N domain-containing protein [Thermodesulfobacteriota bacterium]|nr:MAG: ORF6N domain-containing protein [Thermodesulfobacteriota bacterium]